MSCNVIRTNGLTTIACGRSREPLQCRFCSWSSVAFCDGAGCNAPLCSRHRWAANDREDFCPNCQGALMRSAHRATDPMQSTLF